MSALRSSSFRGGWYTCTYFWGSNRWGWSARTGRGRESDGTSPCTCGGRMLHQEGDERSRQFPSFPPFVYCHIEWNRILLRDLLSNLHFSPIIWLPPNLELETISNQNKVWERICGKNSVIFCKINLKFVLNSSDVGHNETLGTGWSKTIGKLYACVAAL